MIGIELVNLLKGSEARKPRQLILAYFKGRFISVGKFCLSGDSLCFRGSSRSQSTKRYRTGSGLMDGNHLAIDIK